MTDKITSEELIGIGFYYSIDPFLGECYKSNEGIFVKASFYGNGIYKEKFTYIRTKNLLFVETGTVFGVEKFEIKDFETLKETLNKFVKKY